MVKLKSLALIKAREDDAMKQMKSLGKTGSGKMEAFIPKYYEQLVFSTDQVL
jgi:hypothetical protein